MIVDLVLEERRKYEAIIKQQEERIDLLLTSLAQVANLCGDLERKLDFLEARIENLETK